MNHVGTILVPLIMTFRHDPDKKVISARIRRCIVGARIRRRERIILSQERDVIANHTFMTISGVVYQDSAVIVPDKATFLPLNEPTKRQDGWAFLQEVIFAWASSPGTSTPTTSVALAGPFAVDV